VFEPICNATELKRRVRFQENVAAGHRGMLQTTTSFDFHCEELPKELTVRLDEFLKLMVTSLK
jgi:hypothetical protein